MILKEYFQFYDKIFTNNFCDQIIKEFSLKNKEIASTGGGVNFNIRKSSIVFDNTANFIFKETNELIKYTNKNKNWNFKIDYPETFQFTEYALNQFYHWHHDSHVEPYKKGDNHIINKVRKISMSISLSEPEDYEGGDFLLDLRNGDNQNQSNIISDPCMKNKGSAVVFPSFVWHKVLPVTKGTRYSGVIWYLGDAFV